MHHLISTLAIPALLLGSGVWWTGAGHIADNLNATCNKLNLVITNLVPLTRTDLFLYEAALPPSLDLLLDHTSRKYRLRIVRCPDSHPNKLTIRKALLHPL